ncbi:hypothetical protein ACFSHT_15680 [Paraburkholderia silviterrae]|uniref:Uncharacterized protein n=1 Tax=Paraburkholderia silviterrae TaxID=2528715 RepID=A0A4R5M9H3_9BURK|nr:hypothetical protein [Paraburkholderia silviterrae]TDG23266.1 hypothetical protein EYW47_15150 [Paraburkholderia silviterrae]
MVTRSKSPRSRDIACIRIGFEHYLLDADKAMQVLKLMRESVSCHRDYNGRRMRYVAGAAPELELSMIQASEVVMPGAQLALEDMR